MTTRPDTETRLLADLPAEEPLEATGSWPQPSCGDIQCPTVQPTTKRRDRDNPEIEHDRIRDVGTD